MEFQNEVPKLQNEATTPVIKDFDISFKNDRIESINLLYINSYVDIKISV
jgi:hypothetical protein